MEGMKPQPVKLHAQCYGDAALPPLVVLHGLLGSGRNWASMAKRLGDRFAVWAVDLRNHGASPHAADMGYPAMAADLAAFLDREGIRDPVLVGHSMGGKAAMRFAVDAPERVRGLVVVDIAPKPYAARWEKEFAALRALDLGSLRSRSEAEARLEPAIPDWAFRKFLTTNLIRDPETKAFEWTVNLGGLQAALPQLFQKGIGEGESYAGPTLLVRGGCSRFVDAEDIKEMRRHFPRARLETVEGAGHNVHFDAPDAFAERLLTWFSKEIGGP